MLATVLRTKVGVQISIQIMDAFAIINHESRIKALENVFSKFKTFINSWHSSLTSAKKNDITE